MDRRLVSLGLPLALFFTGNTSTAAAKDLHVERSILINTHPARVFAILNDFRLSREWMPYEQKDADMKRTLTGAPRGKGSVYTYEGDARVGAGRVEILESLPFHTILMRLDMHRPFRMTNTVEYRLEQKGRTTEVTWSMRGPMPFFSRLVSLFVDVEGKVGRDFEQGLANLKSLLERPKRNQEPRNKRSALS